MITSAPSPPGYIYGGNPQPKSPSHDASFSRCSSSCDFQRQPETDIRLIKCFAQRLLARNRVCPACFLNMKLVPRRQLTDKLAWHCRDNLCGSRSYHSVRAGSFFAKSRVPVKKAVHLIYLWAQESSVKAAADTLDVSRQCVQQHFQFLREVCSTHLLATPMFLGGRNVIVQIDESLFKHKPKYHRGRAPASEQWVFGICDTSMTPGVTYMEIVPDRRAQTLTAAFHHICSHIHDAYPV